MEPNDLLTSEISFELIVRGITPERTQILRRAQLRGALAKEKKGFQFPAHDNFEFDDEVKQIQITLSNLTKLVTDEGHRFTDVEIRRVESRLIHVQHRISFLKPISESEKNQVGEIEAEILIISGFLVEFKDENNTIVSATTSMLNATESVFPSAMPVFAKNLGINKWGIKFSGLNSKDSVMSFLEKVTELCEARQIKETDLFTSAVDLFSDSGLIWYRNIKKDVHSWSQLVDCLKRDFLPVDYEEDLLAEIRARTQGPNENVIFYIIAVEALFNRLTLPRSELDIIKQIRRNLNPFFSDKLVLAEITSLRDLKDKCRVIQELKSRNDKYHPPPSRKQGLLEPDLACLSVTDEPTSSKHVSVSKPLNQDKKVKCWNCQRVGHNYRECLSPKSIFCYRCGTKDNYSTSCMICSSKNGQEGIAPNPINLTSRVEMSAVPKVQNVTKSRSNFPVQKMTDNPVSRQSMSPQVATFVPSTSVTGLTEMPSTSANLN